MFGVSTRLRHLVPAVKYRLPAFILPTTSSSSANLHHKQQCFQVPMASIGTQASSSAHGRDGIQVLINDHNEMKRLYEAIKAERSSDQKQRLTNEFIRLMSIHDGIELSTLYPMLESKVQNGKQLADHARQDHTLSRTDLYELDQRKVTDADFEKILDKLMQETLNHMGDEEQNLLPKLKQVLSKEELLQLGDSLERARAMAPTRPHPSAPDKGLAGHAAQIMSAGPDRLRDAVGKDFPSSTASSGEKTGASTRSGI